MIVKRKPKKKLVLWNKLGSADECANSLVGKPITLINNPSFEDCKFGKGMKSVYDTSTTGEYGKTQNISELANLTTVGTTKYLDRLSVEMWVKYTDFTVTDGASSDGLIHNIFYGGYDSGTNTNEWGWGIMHYSSGLILRVYDYNGGGGVSIVITNSEITFSLDEVAHWAMSYDTDGIKGTTDTVRLYLNGEPIYTTSTPCRPKIVVSGVDYDDGIFIGGLYGWRPAEGDMVHDNIKVYNYAKTDFSDIEIEHPIKIESPQIYKLPNKDLILWNKSGSVDDTASPKIGNGGTSIGVTYEDCKFGKGSYVSNLAPSSNASGEISYSNNEGNIFGSTTPTAYTFEFEFKYKDYSVTNGGASSIYASENGILFLYNSATNDQFYFWHSTTSTGIRTKKGGVVKLENYLTTGFNIALNEIVNYKLIFDENGIDGGTNTMEFRKNNVVIGSTTSTSSKLIVNGISFGNLLGIAPRPAKGVFDNIKMYNYAKTDSSFQEGMNYVFNKDIPRNPDKKCILWNKLGSSDEITNSEIGENGSINGTVSYSDAKFNKGSVSSYSSGGGYVEFSDWIMESKGHIEVWYKPTYTNTDNVGYPRVVSFGSSGLTTIMFNQDRNEFVVYMEDRLYLLSTTTPWTDTDILHLALSWDNDGINDTNEVIQFFINDVKQVLTNSSITTPFTISGTMTDPLTVCNYSILDRGSIGPIDNIKVYNYAKTDSSDIEIEEIINLNDLEVIPESRR